jgi:flagellar motor protein MotB
VQLTENYTILNLSFVNTNRPRRDRDGNVIDDGSAQVGIHTSALLYGLGGRRSFRLLNAEGIPTFPQQMRTYPGDRLNFTLYFERLDPGIEQFDLFECSDYDQFVCWNFYGINVNNPAPVYTPVPKAQLPEPAPKSSTNTPPASLPNDQPPVVSRPDDGSTSAGPKRGKTGTLPTKTEPTSQPNNTPAPQATVVENALIRGIVRDEKTQLPISAKIHYQLSSKTMDVDSVQGFQETGLYKIYLPTKQIYTYTVSARGYLLMNDFLDLSKTANGQTIVKDITLKPIEVGGKVALNNIFFEASKSDLLEASFAELNKLVKLMKENPTMEIRLEGHTDIVGDKAANLQLSKDRVWEVRKYAVRNGINAARIQTIGYGDTKPIITKGTDEERKVNRRVEFVILKT